MAEGARFTRGSTMGHVVRMTLAGALGLTFLFLIDVATLFWISRLRDEQLMAALGFVWVVQFFIVSSGIGISIATSTLVSRSIGQGKRAHARCQASAALVMAFAVQGLIAMTVLVLREPVLALAGADGATREIASRFLSVTLFSMPVMALAMVGGAVLRALGDAWRSMMVTMSAGAVAMVLDPVFIFWLDMGIDGAAWVMVIARLTAAGMALWFLIGVHDILARVTLADMRALFRPFAAIAAPATMTQLSTPFGNALLTGLVAGYGDGAVAGWAVVSRLSVLTFGGIYVLSGAIGGILGQNFGAGLLERVRRTYRDALVFCVIYTGVAWSLLYAARGLVVEAFSLGPDGARVVLAFAGIAAGGFVFTGILFVSNAAFNTLGRPFWSTSFNWLRDGIVLYPLALMLSLRFGAPGVIYGQALAGVVVGTVAGLAGWRFVKGLEPAGGGIDKTRVRNK